MSGEAKSGKSQLMRLASNRKAAPLAAYCCRQQLDCSCIATTVSMLLDDAAIREFSTTLKTCTDILLAAMSRMKRNKHVLQMQSADSPKFAKQWRRSSSQQLLDAPFTLLVCLVDQSSQPFSSAVADLQLHLGLYGTALALLCLLS